MFLAMTRVSKTDLLFEHVFYIFVQMAKSNQGAKGTDISYSQIYFDHEKGCVWGGGGGGGGGEGG